MLYRALLEPVPIHQCREDCSLEPVRGTCRWHIHIHDAEYELDVRLPGQRAPEVKSICNELAQAIPEELHRICALQALRQADHH